MNKILDVYNQWALSVRAYNILKRTGFDVVEDLKDVSYKYLIGLKGCTHNVAIEILNLSSNVLTLKDQDIINKEIENILLLNERFNNKRVISIIKLARDKASTIDEKLNCIDKCKIILDKAV